MEYTPIKGNNKTIKEKIFSKFIAGRYSLPKINFIAMGEIKKVNNAPAKETRIMILITFLNPLSNLSLDNLAKMGNIAIDAKLRSAAPDVARLKADW